MNIQYIIVALIILAAVIYAGNTLRHKISAFKPRKKTDSCGADCGCAAKEKNKAAKI